MKRYRAIAVLLGAGALAACEKNTVQDITSAPLTSAVRFFNFGLNSPGVNFYANTTKMTAILSSTGAEATTGTPYGSVGAGGFYTGIEPGQYALTAKIAATTNHNLTISSVNANLEAGKSYSVFMSGVYDTTTKSVDGFMVEDPIPAQLDFSVATVRFVNAISNSSPMTLYAKNTVSGIEIALGGSIAYKSAGAFATLPPGIYDLATRTAGSSTNAIARTAVTLAGGRVYTIGARGDITITSTTATNRPFLDNTPNR